MHEQIVKVRTLRVIEPEPARSTYIDTNRGPGIRHEDIHSWAEFTADRLAWLYQGADRHAAQAADLKAWRELGQ